MLGCSSDGATPAEAFPFNQQSHTPPPKAGGVTPPGSRVAAGDSAERQPLGRDERERPSQSGSSGVD